MQKIYLNSIEESINFYTSIKQIFAFDHKDKVGETENKYKGIVPKEREGNSTMK